MISTVAEDCPLKNNKDLVLSETKALRKIDGLMSSSS